VGGGTDAGNTVGRVYRWNMATNKEEAALEGEKGRPISFAFGSGHSFGAGQKGGSFAVWDLSTGKAVLSKAKAHADDVRDITFSPNGERIVTASQDLTFKLWENKTGKDILTLQSSALQRRDQFVAPERTAFSPDARVLLTITKPFALAPVLLEAFPWKKEELDKLPGEKLQEKIEAFKRSDRGLAELLPKQ
jgi:WD40 repeat protein